jgi:hypothetical protein
VGISDKRAGARIEGSAHGRNTTAPSRVLGQVGLRVLLLWRRQMLLLDGGI